MNNWLDFVLAITLGISTIAGLIKGFSRTVVGVITALVALVTAIWMYGLVGSFFLDWVSHPKIADFIGFTLVFLGVMLIGEIIGRVLSKLFRWVGLGWLDRLLGGGVGAVRGLLVAMGIVLLLCSFTREPPPKSVVESRIAPYVIDASSVLASMAPRGLRDGFDTSYVKAKEVWREMLREIQKKRPERV